MEITEEYVKVPEEQRGLSYREYELVREFSKARMEAKSELPFESLDDYEIPPRVQFSMLSKPAVSIKYKELTFNMACVRMFEEINYVVPSLNRKKKRLAVLMRKEDGASTVMWSRKNAKGVLVNRTITSLEFVETIYETMGWDRNLRFKALGRIANSPEGLILVFDLEEAVHFDPLPEEYTDPQTGEVKKHVKVYYPEKYRGHVGNYYNDYVAKEQINIFETLEDYSDKVEVAKEPALLPDITDTGGIDNG
jgi:hypothetical protein